MLMSDSIEVLMDRKETGAKYDGITPKVLATVKGEKVLIKGDSRTREQLAEYFASKLGQLLGLSINKVELIDCGDLFNLNKICSVHWWEDEFIISRDGDGASSNEQRIMDFFDAIISNEDRHGGNYGHIKGELFLIDHGLSYPWQEFDEGDHYSQIKRAIRNPVSRKVVEKFISLDDTKIVEILNFPKELNHGFEDSMLDNILYRMSEAKKFTKQLLEEFIIEEVA